MANEFTQRWNERALEMIPLGSKVVAVEYMSDEEKADAGFHKRPVTIWIERPDGTRACLYPQRDDEGNDAGSLGIFSPSQVDYPILPTL